MTARSKILILFKRMLTVFPALIILSACSSLQRHEDAIRIKNENIEEYYKKPGDKGFREGSVLNGTVVNVIVKAVPDSCPATEETKRSYEKSIVFLDQSLEDEDENYELIPYEHIVPVSSLFEMPDNGFGNINKFENYNDAALFKGLREVPVDSIEIDTCCPCKCKPWDLSIGLDLDLDLSLSCVVRDFYSIFLELRGAYAVYTDIESRGVSIGRDAWPFEISTGVRFGGNKEWGLGITYSSGVKSYNSFKAEDILRAVILLHGRWQSPKDKFIGLCMRPFVYADFGMAIDKLSLNLFDFNFNSDCENCKRVIEDLNVPGLDISTPLSYGIGAGFDIPIAPFLDISVDMGWRSLAFGEALQVAGFDNVPSLRRVNMFLFRFGLTI